jgi:hypothetical protein
VLCRYDEEIAQPPPIMEKVENAVEKLKNNKSSWVDNLQAELLKYSGNNKQTPWSESASEP